MNKGYYFTNQNIKQTCCFEYTHLNLFDEIINEYNIKECLPIDVELYQYIDNDNYNSLQLSNILLQYIEHFCNKHNNKVKFYFLSESGLIIFCNKLPNNVSNFQKKSFTKKLKENNINKFIFISINKKYIERRK